MPIIFSKLEAPPSIFTNLQSRNVEFQDDLLEEISELMMQLNFIRKENTKRLLESGAVSAAASVEETEPKKILLHITILAIVFMANGLIPR